MRFVVYGVGAVGGVLAAALVDAGVEVVGIARGLQMEALRTSELIMHSRAGDIASRIDVVASPEEIAFRDDDVVLLAVKSQDTEAARSKLSVSAGPDVPIVCVQNGVANERSVLRTFRHVYGAVVFMPVPLGHRRDCRCGGGGARRLELRLSSCAGRHALEVREDDGQFDQRHRGGLWPGYPQRRTWAHHQ